MQVTEVEKELGSDNGNAAIEVKTSHPKNLKRLLWDFFGKVVVSAMLWICVGIGLMLYPLLAYNTGGTRQFPTFASNVAIFYDTRLAWAVLGGGVLLCVVFAIVSAVLKKFTNKPPPPGEESLFTMSMGELSSQLVGFASLLLASSVFYLVDRTFPSPVFDPKTKGQLLLIPSLVMLVFAFFIYWLAYAENKKRPE